MSTSELLTWNKTRDRLRSFVLRHTKDHTAADDIIQEVFLKVHANLHQLKETEKLVGWIFKIARNAIIDHFRTNGKIIHAHDIDWDTENNPLNDCVFACLHEMMETLPDKYREALQLTELENFSQLQLARALNISYSGAKSRVQRARQMLKDKMDAAYLIKFDAYGNVVVCKDKIPCSCSEKGIS